MNRLRILVTLSMMMIAAAIAAPPATAATIFLPVAGNAGPWDPILNAGFDYGVHDQGSASIVNAGTGISFASGGNITIQYFSGSAAVGVGYALTDARGNTAFPFDNFPNPNGFAPSFYINHLSYPVYSGELVGTFTDALGIIVGTPFAIGLGPVSVTVPNGVSRLQLGINDNLFADNSGSFTVQVSSLDLTAPLLVGVPEPASLLLFASGVAGIVMARWPRRSAKRASSNWISRA